MISFSMYYQLWLLQLRCWNAITIHRPETETKTSTSTSTERESEGLTCFGPVSVVFIGLLEFAPGKLLSPDFSRFIGKFWNSIWPSAESLLSKCHSLSVSETSSKRKFCPLRQRNGQNSRFVISIDFCAISFRRGEEIIGQRTAASVRLFFPLSLHPAFSMTKIMMMRWDDDIKRKVAHRCAQYLGFENLGDRVPKWRDEEMKRTILDFRRKIGNDSKSRGQRNLTHSLSRFRNPENRPDWRFSRCSWPFNMDLKDFLSFWQVKSFCLLFVVKGERSRIEEHTCRSSSDLTKNSWTIGIVITSINWHIESWFGEFHVESFQSFLRFYSLFVDWSDILDGDLRLLLLIKDLKNIKKEFYSEIKRLMEKIVQDSFVILGMKIFDGLIR